jgi:ribose transport system ATP-binding protein
MAQANSVAAPLPSERTGAGQPSIIVAENVVKTFGETKALRSASFTAHAGEIHAIVGENGSGKSTLAKIMSGIVLADSGSVLMNGEIVHDPIKALQTGVATVYQEVLIAEGASIMDNVFMGLEGPWRPRTSRKRRFHQTKELLERLTRQPVDPTALVDDLPLATRQWITIARALIRSPRVVIFDESTAALDLDSASRLLAEMQRLRSEGVCVVVVTHRIAELTTFADRATVLRDGRDVGVLAGDEITLERLLSLMSGVDPETEDGAASQVAIGRRGAVDRSTPVLAARQVVTSEGAAPSNLELFPGEIIGFAGLDGQGQSAFIQALTGARPIESGEIIARDSNESRSIRNLRDAAAAKVCYISGDRRMEGIFSNLSIFENFAMPLFTSFRRFGFVDRGALKKTYRHHAGRLNLRAASPDDLITSLSGGNQQKVIIGRVLAQRPRVVALNDPARGVDIRTKRELYGQLEQLALEGAGIIYLSTEIDELVGLCDRVAVFREGALFGWIAGEQITSDRVLAAMFGHLESDFDVEQALAGQS